MIECLGAHPFAAWRYLICPSADPEPVPAVLSLQDEPSLIPAPACPPPTVEQPVISEPVEPAPPEHIPATCQPPLTLYMDSDAKVTSSDESMCQVVLAVIAKQAATGMVSLKQVRLQAEAMLGHSLSHERKRIQQMVDAYVNVTVAAEPARAEPTVGAALEAVPSVGVTTRKRRQRSLE